ncbi:MAG TPA: hypothetical protein RMH99_07280 [Sandaracinaceae bacterium LLY-WYZ-13_1]|nr:hypothetical protein [Sandaracinaceae bacterium LLY-WYZ-13_1]
MRLPWYGLALASGVLLVGCSALINPDDGRLGSSPDAGTSESDASSPGEDGGPDPRPDGGDPGTDAGASGCTSEEPRCEGDALVTCVGGMEVRQDCRARSAYCDEGECVDWECEPGSRECADDLRTSLVCDARGTGVMEVVCPVACDPTDGSCTTSSDRCMDAPSVTLGSTHMVDLCIKNDDHTFRRAPGCGVESRADGGDTVFRLEVPSRREVTIELSDVDTTAAIDTIVYLRRLCDAEGSQVACDDDVRCEDSTVPGELCIGGADVRQSRITTRLEPGTYYVVLDHFEYTRGEVRFGCGEVRLTLE